jgi:hypothetical protein
MATTVELNAALNCTPAELELVYMVRRAHGELAQNGDAFELELKHVRLIVEFVLDNFRLMSKPNITHPDVQRYRSGLGMAKPFGYDPEEEGG